MRRLERGAIVVGVAVLPLDLLVAHAVSLAQPGYDPVSQFMSELAVPGRTGARLLAIWWCVYGTSLVALALAIRTIARRLATPRVPWIELLVVGMGLGIGTALFPCDPGCRGETTSARLHEVLGLLGCLGLVVGAWRMPRAWVDRRVARLLAALVLVAFVLQLAAGMPGSPLASERGALQRLFLVVGYAWVACLARAAWARVGEAPGLHGDPEPVVAHAPPPSSQAARSPAPRAAPDDLR